MFSFVALRDAERALTTISTGGSSCWCERKDSRIRRLTRLRRTALPTVFAAIDNPRRATEVGLARTTSAKKVSV